MNDERRCLVIDEQPAIRVGVRGMLADRYEVEEAADGRDALELITSLGNFDVAIVDLPSGDGHGNALVGLAAIKALRKARPGLGIVAHGSRPERARRHRGDRGRRHRVRRQELGRDGALPRGGFRRRFRDLRRPGGAGKKNGSLALTRRQREILQLYANGLSTEDAAKHLGLSTETIRTHTKAVLSRLEARDRTHAVAIGMRSRLIE